MCKLLRFLFPVLSVYAACICTLWLCPSLPRLLSNKELQFDYIGAIVGVLSLLVTVLVGWNIMYAINSKDRIKKEIKRYVDEAIKETKAEMSEHFILEETTFCNAYAKTKEWDKVLPLLRNTALRYFELAQQNKNDDFDISGYVEVVAEFIDKIDNDCFNNQRSEFSGFMETFKQLWKYDERILTIYNDTQDKLRK